MEKSPRVRVAEAILDRAYSEFRDRTLTAPHEIVFYGEAINEELTERDAERIAASCREWLIACENGEACDKRWREIMSALDDEEVTW